MPPIPPITKWLLISNVAAYFIDDLLRLSTGFSLASWFALWPLGHGFLPWQLVSYAFLHHGAFHLFFNMMGLWMFGSELERLWGQRRYIYMLLASTLAAALVQLLFNMMIGPALPTVGASGALFGLLLCYGVLFPNRTIMPLFPPIPMKARTFVIVFGVIELALGVSGGGGGGGIAHFAHLGGMVGGFLMIRYWRHQPPFRSRRR